MYVKIGLSDWGRGLKYPLRIIGRSLHQTGDITRHILGGSLFQGLFWNTMLVAHHCMSFSKSKYDASLQSMDKCAALLQWGVVDWEWHLLGPDSCSPIYWTIWLQEGGHSLCIPWHCLMFGKWFKCWALQSFSVEFVIHACRTNSHLTSQSWGSGLDLNGSTFRSLRRRSKPYLNCYLLAVLCQEVCGFLWNNAVSGPTSEHPSRVSVYIPDCLSEGTSIYQIWQL